MRLAIAAAISIAGLPLLVTGWPLPMVGLAFLFAGAWLAVSGALRRRPEPRKIRR